MRKRFSAVLAAAAVTGLVAGVPGTAGAATTWTVQSVPLPAGVNLAYLTGVSCPTATFCVAADPADGFAPNSSAEAPEVEVWNGTTWTAQSLPQAPTLPGWVTAVSCASESSCVAVGYYEPAGKPNGMLAEVWNGSTWKASVIPQVTTGDQDGTLTSVSCFAGGCIAVGNWTSGDGAVEMPLAEHWNGKTWTEQTLPAVPQGTSTDLRGVSCVAATQCTAVGSGNGAQGPTVVIEQRNLGAWKLVDGSTPVDPGSQLNSVSCVQYSYCFAAGGTVSNSGTSLPFVMRSVRSLWRDDTTLSSGLSTGSLTGISCSAVGTTDGGARLCIAVGAYRTSADPQHNRPLVEYWNHREWKMQTTPAPQAKKTMSAVSCLSSALTCTAVGYQYVQGSGYQQPLAERN